MCIDFIFFFFYWNNFKDRNKKWKSTQALLSSYLCINKFFYRTVIIIILQLKLLVAFILLHPISCLYGFFHNIKVPNSRLIHFIPSHHQANRNSISRSNPKLQKSRIKDYRSTCADLYSNRSSFRTKSSAKHDEQRAQVADRGTKTEVQLETVLITIWSIEERVIETRNSRVTMQLQPHPKINRIATRSIYSLGPFVTQPCTMPRYQLLDASHSHREPRLSISESDKGGRIAGHCCCIVLSTICAGTWTTTETRINSSSSLDTFVTLTRWYCSII